jgi:hypothetical protein
MCWKQETYGGCDDVLQIKDGVAALVDTPFVPPLLVPYSIHPRLANRIDKLVDGEGWAGVVGRPAGRSLGLAVAFTGTTDV